MESSYHEMTPIPKTPLAEALEALCVVGSNFYTSHRWSVVVDSRCERCGKPFPKPTKPLDECRRESDDAGAE